MLCNVLYSVCEYSNSGFAVSKVVERDGVRRRATWS